MPIHLITLFLLVSLSAASLYLIVCFFIILLSSKIPRNPVPDLPDWGTTRKYRIPTVKNKTLEAIIVIPDGIKVPDEGFSDQWKERHTTIILLHGWGRNQGRMVSRARIYGKHEIITILFSVRDHGDSDRELTGMNILRFSEDLTSVVHWWGSPVFLTGHSIGGGASLLVASREPLIKGVISEAPPYALPQSMEYIMRPGLRRLTPLFVPGMWLIVRLRYHKYQKTHFSPLDAAPLISIPTLLIHGTKDSFFPVKHSIILDQALPHSNLWIVEGGNHYNLNKDPKYETRVVEFMRSCMQGK